MYKKLQEAKVETNLIAVKGGTWPWYIEFTRSNGKDDPMDGSTFEKLRVVNPSINNC